MEREIIINSYSFDMSWEDPFSWERFLSDWQFGGGDFRFLLGPPNEFHEQQSGMLLMKYMPDFEREIQANFTRVKSVLFSPATRIFMAQVGPGVASIVWQETGSGNDLITRAREDISRLARMVYNFYNKPYPILIMGDMSGK